MSIEPIIARLTGQAEHAAPLSAAGVALARRLRAMVESEAGEGGFQRSDQTPDHGPAADALQLAAYLDGAMTAMERDAFEAALAQSPGRREALIAAVAWIEEVATRNENPPAALTALAIALEDGPKPAGRAGVTGFIEWLLPRPRLAIATSALASIAIVAVGFDIALHMSPSLRPAVQSPAPQVAPAADRPASGVVMRETSMLPPMSAAVPIHSPQPSVPRDGDPFVLTAETINALIAYRNDPSPARRTELLAVLARSGAPAVPVERVRTITVQSLLLERLTKPAGGLPTRIATRLSMDGVLSIAGMD